MAKFFLKKLAGYGDSLALVDKDGMRYSYEALVNRAMEFRRELDSMKGNILAVVGDFSLDCIAVLLAGIDKDMVILPLCEEPQMESKLHEVGVDLIYQGALLRAFDSIASRESLSVANPQESIKAAMLDKAMERGGAIVLFSSGSTGRPKALVHSLESFISPYLSKGARPICVLLFLMFDHIGGLHTLFSTLGRGGCGVVPSNRKDPISIAASLQEHRISLLPASPSFLQLFLISGAIASFNLDSLRLVTYGTESMPPSLLSRLKAALPWVRFHETFGASEVGIIQTSSRDGAFRLEGVQYKVVDGQLHIKSSTRAIGYLNASNEAFDEDGYFATGDLVDRIMVDGKEYLRVRGRAKEVINVGGQKVLPQEVEGALLALPFVIDCLVFGRSNALSGQAVAARVVVDERAFHKSFKSLIGGNTSLCSRSLKKLIRLLCKDRLESFKLPSFVELVDCIDSGRRFKRTRLDI